MKNANKEQLPEYTAKPSLRKVEVSFKRKENKVVKSVSNRRTIVIKKRKRKESSIPKSRKIIKFFSEVTQQKKKIRKLKSKRMV